MDITRWDPVQEMRALRDTINHIFEDRLFRPSVHFLTGLEGPLMDVYETDALVNVHVQLPGVKPEEVEITLSGTTLTIKGERQREAEVQEGQFYRKELSYGSFSRAIVLPAGVDADQVVATFEDGVLTLAFPKKAEEQPKRIAIKPQLKAREVER